MDKEQQQKPLDEQTVTNNAEEKNKEDTQTNNQAKAEESNKEKEISPEEKISELEDKLARTFAEMENQRRRFEKEKEDAFEYGGS